MANMEGLRQKLKGFECRGYFCYDMLGGVGDENARQVGIMGLKQRQR